MAPSHLNQAVTGPGVVVTVAEARKRLKYEVISLTYNFSPIANETFGALGEEATEFVKDLAARIKNATKESRDFEFLVRRLSVSMQRGNAVVFWVHYHQRRTWIFFIFLDADRVSPTGSIRDACDRNFRPPLNTETAYK
jgi:hypothetical protein